MNNEEHKPMTSLSRRRLIELEDQVSRLTLKLQMAKDAFDKILQKSGSHTVTKHDPPIYKRGEDPGFAGIYEVAEDALANLKSDTPMIKGV